MAIASSAARPRPGALVRRRRGRLSASAADAGRMSDRSCAAATVVLPMDTATPGVTRPIDVIIADDHAVVRDGTRAVLQREGGEFRVVAEAADIPSMIRDVREHKPDLLTLDLT